VSGWQAVRDRVDLRLHGYNDAQGRVFFDRRLRDVRALPGVERAALTDGFPGGGYAATRPVQIVTAKEALHERGEMRVLPGEVRRLTAGYAGASPGLLETLGLPLIRGRDIAPSDQDSTPLVAVVSRNVAGVLWPGQDPAGKRLMFGNDGHWRTVVGVSEDPITHRTESPLTSPANMVLIPGTQAYRPDALIVGNVLDEAVTVLLLGLLAGVFITSVSERYLQSQRFGFMSNEISTGVGVLLLIVAVGLLAAYPPARRVARIDPNEALREL
jgi:hypothetical protein